MRVPPDDVKLLVLALRSKDFDCGSEVVRRRMLSPYALVRFLLVPSCARSVSLSLVLSSPREFEKSGFRPDSFTTNELEALPFSRVSRSIVCELATIVGAVTGDLEVV